MISEELIIFMVGGTTYEEVRNLYLGPSTSEPLPYLRPVIPYLTLRPSERGSIRLLGITLTYQL